MSDDNNDAEGEKADPGFGPKDGSWGPQNAQTAGLSGADYVNAIADNPGAGSSRYNGMSFGHDYQGGAGQMANPRSAFPSDPSPYSSNNPGLQSRRSAMDNTMSALHGGGFLGDLGRGLAGAFGFSGRPEMMPGGGQAAMGLQAQFNPGALLGFASPIPGLGMLGQGAWDMAGLPQVPIGGVMDMADPFAQPTLTQQAMSPDEDERLRGMGMLY